MPAIKPIIIFFIFLLSSLKIMGVSHRSCQFKTGIQISLLSGAMTSLVREIGLLESQQVQFVSDLFLTKSEKQKKHISHKLIRGGLFLSVRSMKKMKDSYVFFDQSQELRKQFSRIKLAHQEEIVTRGLDPFEASQYSLERLRPFLTRNCSAKVHHLQTKWKSQLSRIEQMDWSSQQVIFFLGSINQRRLPQTMILNDGFVKLLKKYKKIKTYPSSLDYSTWSQKILEKFIDKNTLLIGINTNEDLGFSVKAYNNNKIDTFDFEVLIPGVGQLKFLESLAKWQETLKLD